MRLGCIADDFTGATDLAGLLRRSGANVRLHLGHPSTDADGSADIEIIALKCRTEPVIVAVSACEKAAQWLMEHGAEKLYWKYCSTFDSTSLGNIGPVAEALIELTGQKQAVYCPAFPENGRSVFMGHLFVGNELLSESSLKDHPLTPMTDSNLVRVLEPQVQGSVGLWSRIDQQTAKPFPTTTHVIADAVEFSDLEHLIKQIPDSVLLTGGSALAMSIPDNMGLSKSRKAPNPITRSRAIILSGSCSEMTRKQVNEWTSKYPSYKLNPLELDPQALTQCLTWFANQGQSTCLIYATDSPESVKTSQKVLGVAEAGERIEAAMGFVAQTAYAHGVRQFVVAGGETSGAVTQALGIKEVVVGDEICPGVPWVYGGPSDDPIALALKSGNFGSNKFFTDALEVLMQS